MSASTPAPKKLFIKTYGCQMNVYDGERMAESDGRAKGYETPDAAEAPIWSAQHLPYPRKGGRKGLFGARPASRDWPRSKRLSVAPLIGLLAAWRRRRARRSSAASRRRRGRARRPITACPSWSRSQSGRAAESTRICRRGSSSLRSRAKSGDTRGPYGVPDRAGRLRQVLRLLRCAVYARRRGLSPVRRSGAGRGDAIWSRRASSRSRCWART